MTSVRPNLKPETPKALTAWDARTGKSVWWAGQSQWSVSIDKAKVMSGSEAIDALATARTQETQIVEPYLMEVNPDGSPSGRETIRENLRADIATAI